MSCEVFVNSSWIHFDPVCEKIRGYRNETIIHLTEGNSALVTLALSDLSILLSIEDAIFIVIYVMIAVVIAVILLTVVFSLLPRKWKVKIKNPVPQNARVARFLSLPASILLVCWLGSNPTPNTHYHVYTLTLIHSHSTRALLLRWIKHGESCQTSCQKPIKPQCGRKIRTCKKFNIPA